MENWLRTGGKSLGDKVCLQPFMFQRRVRGSCRGGGKAFPRAAGPNPVTGILYFIIPSEKLPVDGAADCPLMSLLPPLRSPTDKRSLFPKQTDLFILGQTSSAHGKNASKRRSGALWRRRVDMKYRSEDGQKTPHLQVQYLHLGNGAACLYTFLLPVSLRASRGGTGSDPAL